MGAAFSLPVPRGRCDVGCPALKQKRCHYQLPELYHIDALPVHEEMDIQNSTCYQHTAACIDAKFACPQSLAQTPLAQSIQNHILTADPQSA